MEKEYTILVLAENYTGITNRITTILFKQKVNILSLTGSESEIPNVYKICIVVHTKKEIVDNLAKQIDKQVDVLMARVYEADDLVYQEMALYKLPYQDVIADKNFNQLLKQYNASILSVDSDFIVILKTGEHSETQELFDRLNVFKVLEFARSGRVVITKTKHNEFL